MPSTPCAEDYEAAVAEAEAYLRMGGLDDSIVLDIAHDHGVDAAELAKKLDREPPSSI